MEKLRQRRRGMAKALRRGRVSRGEQFKCFVFKLNPDMRGGAGELALTIRPNISTRAKSARAMGETG